VHNDRFFSLDRKDVMAKTEKTETSTHGFFDVTKAFGDFRLPGLDVEAIVATQRKNLEALTEANQLAVEGVRALAQRQAEIAQQAFAEASALFRAWTQPGAPEERLAKNADVAKQAFEKGFADVRELGELTAKASTDVFSVMARRVSESFDEARLYAKKHSSAD
jgi:phasin family protein